MNANPYHTIQINGYRLIFLLTICVVSLISIHLLLQFIHYELQEIPWLLRQLFDVDEENNIPTWYSSMALFLSAALTFLIVLRKRSESDRWTTYWSVIAAGLLLLSLDEIAGLHETVNTLTEVSWAVPGLILVGVIAIFYIRFLMSLPARTIFLFVTAGGIFLGGAVGVELATEWYAEMELLDTLAYNSWTAVEEGMEMAGVVLLNYALIDYMKSEEKLSVSVLFS